MSILSIDEIQEQIIKEFAALEDDKESMITYIMECGNKMPSLEDHYKTDHNTITGCMSKVWLVHEKEGDCLIFKADSNTEITRGLISLLIRVFSRQKVDDIINTHVYFIDKIGMGQLIGSQRSNGFANMIKQIKLLALMHKTKMEQQEELAIENDPSTHSTHRQR